MLSGQCWPGFVGGVSVTGRTNVRRSKAVIRTLSGTVFQIRLRGKRRVATRVSNGVQVGCVHVLPKSEIGIRVSPCSLAGNHVSFECGWFFVVFLL